ncbi:MAG: prohibitin family protein [Deltaproteobacteria bacterium]|nr:prohibitin family protein [Deltaproteobacteria bacterium]
MIRWSRVLLLALIPLFSTACVIVEDGQVGISKSFGKIGDEPVPQGIAFVIPVVRQIETWNIKLQEYKEQATVPSSEGLIVGLDTSLLFKVESGSVPTIRKTIGTERVYYQTLILPYFRNALRDVVAGYPVKNIYSEQGRKEIADKIKQRLVESLGPRGVTVVDVLLRDVQLPQRFRESIEQKLTAEQRVQQKGFELAQAEKDALIEVARARGAAEAQAIVRSTLSGPYLQYLWIKTLSENPNVIYVATEANLPLFKNAK